MRCRDISQRKIGAILGYLNIILRTAVNFIYIPLLLYYIGKEEFGLYQLIGSLIACFIVMDFGLSDMVVRFFSGYNIVFIFYNDEIVF